MVHGQEETKRAAGPKAPMEPSGEDRSQEQGEARPLVLVPAAEVLLADQEAGEGNRSPSKPEVGPREETGWNQTEEQKAGRELEEVNHEPEERRDEGGSHSCRTQAGHHQQCESW